MDGGLRALYRSLELPGTHPLRDAHAALDAAVMGAYGFAGAVAPRTGRQKIVPEGRSTRGILARLLALNLEIAAAIARGEAVTPPGVPPSFGDPAGLITEDCIRAS